MQEASTQQSPAKAVEQPSINRYFPGGFEAAHVGEDVEYDHPTNTLKFLETLVPNNTERNYLLSFIRTKWSTYRYSSTILFFYGVRGSGKDLFMSLLSPMAKPDMNTFLSPFNGWLLDNQDEIIDFAQLDDYDDVFKTSEFMMKIKSYTSENTINIRSLRKLNKEYDNKVTFILNGDHQSVNAFKGDLPSENRRIAFIETPNSLVRQRWVIENGGVEYLYRTMLSETSDFYDYLANEVENLSPTDYANVPEQLKLFY